MKNIPAKTLFLFFLCHVSLQLFSQGLKEPAKKYQVKIRVYDKETQEELTGAYLKLVNLTKNKLVDSTVVLDGYATFTLERGFDYDIVGQRTKYLTKRANFNAACYLQDPQKVFCIAGIEIENMSRLGGGTDLIEGAIGMKRIRLNDVFKVENIHYDFNKSNIRPDAAKELDKLIQLLIDNPGVSVELGSHTDSRSGADYNLNLSQKRAESAVNYIVGHGKIAKNRISAKGYGEEQLVNKCADGVNCTEIEHAANRRTEIKITGYAVNGVPIDIKQ
ncbi:MAG: OmpA family protein [Flectobacillus sp.]|uniref:OmpA family protein n=1 Tax=Flectobacillus sp. TaxID=50419 RepID=UPI003B9BF954